MPQQKLIIHLGRDFLFTYVNYFQSCSNQKAAQVKKFERNRFEYYCLVTDSYLILICPHNTIEKQKKNVSVWL
jgi:hypothetical protein